MIIFIGGKGGVGKTTCSAAYALKSAKDNLKTLLISTDPAHSTSDIFETDIRDEITNIMPNLDALEINAARESKEYMDRVRLSLKNVVSPIIIEQIDKQIDAAAISPGTEEAALFDKMVDIITHENSRYDKIIFDTAPTGHTLRLLTLPELLGSWLDTLISKRKKSISLMSMAEHKGYAEDEKIENDAVINILKNRFDKIQMAKNIMMDRKKLSFIFVTNAEKLIIDETIKAVKILEKHNIAINEIIVNKILPDNLKDEFWVSKKQQEKKYLDIIKESFKDKKIFLLPLLQEDMKSNNIEVISKGLRELS